MFTLSDTLDSAIRIIFWLFLDGILSSRFIGLHHHLYGLIESVTQFCPDCTNIQRTHMVLLFFFATVISVLAVSLYTRGLLILSAITFAVTAAWIGSIIYALLLHIVSHPWLGSNALIQFLTYCHFTLALLIAVCTLIYMASGQHLNSAPWLHTVLLSAFPLLISWIVYLPLTVHFPEVTVSRCLLNTSEHNAITPALSSYTPQVFQYPDTSLEIHISSESFVSLTLFWQTPGFTRERMWETSAQTCPANIDPVCTAGVTLINILLVKIYPYSLFALYGAVICLWILFFPFTQRLATSIVREVELYETTGFFGFLTFHWNRLNIPFVLGMVWISKLVLVVIMGPDMWPVLPDQPTSVILDSNITVVRDFILPPKNQTNMATFWNRIYVGSMVHGSETWLVVFGAAAFFSGIATMVVHAFVFLLDPSGEEMRQLMAATADVPLNLHDWDVIEDPALALDQHDFLAVEMLRATSWNCAVVFLFLAFQYDLPSLPLAQRICCSLYGLIVIGISCIHPVQALIKSLLLHRGIPGRDNSWFSHLRLLTFCIFLILSSVCILTYVPEGLAEYIHVNSTQFVAGSESIDLEPNASTILVPRFGSSFKSLKARQFRIVLCGCQLLLGLVVTLVEYVIYQFSHRYPNWTGFRSVLFLTRVISSVIDYLISLTSFFTLCWLSIYDSIGLCRLLIICCYFYFILYPSAASACSWLRWRLLAKWGIQQLSNPSTKILEEYGDDCPICYTTMTTENAKVTRCGHLYHTDCLTTWMRRQFFCPICHAGLLSSSVKNRRRLGTPDTVN